MSIPNEMKIAKLIFCVVACAVAGTALAGELLTGVVDAGGEEIAFSLFGEDRENVMGGDITLGERVFKIGKVSRVGSIGAARLVVDQAAGKRHGEFVTFSSSFSAQTATGQPWVAAQRYVNCDSPYNSFLALYKVVGAEALEALGPVPYSILNEDAGAADQSTVYCFMSGPP